MKDVVIVSIPRGDISTSYAPKQATRVHYRQKPEAAKAAAPRELPVTTWDIFFKAKLFVRRPQGHIERERIVAEEQEGDGRGKPFESGTMESVFVDPCRSLPDRPQAAFGYVWIGGSTDSSDECSNADYTREDADTNGEVEAADEILESQWVYKSPYTFTSADPPQFSYLNPPIDVPAEVMPIATNL